jgi:two-component system, chemotaxis family, protein-glutamate methylesterase/glutaminase
VSEGRIILCEEQQVIALIASAGGLEAVSTVLQGLPEDLHAGVVVLIHQAPDRENALVHLLQRRSRLPVVAGQDGAPLAAGTVVVAPPGKHTLVTSGGRIALIVSGASPPSRPSADLLLATLATACGALATAVVLSGGGHDGATGATAIHHLGGRVIASSEATSTYPSMPQATIERAHFVDQIAELNDIAGVLRTIVNAPARSNTRGRLSAG